MRSRNDGCSIRTSRIDRSGPLTPTPGPNAIASFSLTASRTIFIAFVEIRPRSSSGRAMVVKDGSIEATMGKTLLGVATRTSPAPARKAARPARAAAPLIPTLPAIIQTLPKSPLCASAGRGFSLGIDSITCIQTCYITDSV